MSYFALAEEPRVSEVECDADKGQDEHKGADSRRQGRECQTKPDNQAQDYQRQVPNAVDHVEQRIHCSLLFRF